MDLKTVAPCYLYDEKEIRNACKELKTKLTGFDFLYSVKANPFEPIVRCVADEGFGTDAASPGEVMESLKCGIDPENTYYSAPGKTKDDILLTAGKCVLIADSLHEIHTVQQIAAEKGESISIGIRVHPGFTMDGNPQGSSKFGIDLENLQGLKNILNNCPDVLPVGIHVHLKSQVLDIQKLTAYYLNVMETALMLRKELGMEIRFINFGSGIGTVYDPDTDQPVDLKKLAEGLQPVHEINRKLHARLLIETGRYVVCNAGRYITPVVDKKVSHDTTYLIVRNGLNGFIRPAVASMLKKVVGDQIPGMEPLFTKEKEFEVRVLNDNVEQETVTVVGNLCTAMDTIREDVTMNKAEIGDLIEISNAGSYGYTLSPLLFANHTAPKQYMIDTAIRSGPSRWTSATNPRFPSTC